MPTRTLALPGPTDAPALGDEGKPWYDAKNAAHFSAMDIPVFACTPEGFAALMAAALAKMDLRHVA